MNTLRYLSIFVILAILSIGQQCSSSESEDASSEEEVSLSPKERTLAQGKRIYKKHCISCHGMDGKMGFNGAKDLTESQLTFNERKVLIAYGKASMMAFKSILSTEEIEAAARYSMTFSEVDE